MLLFPFWLLALILGIVLAVLITKMVMKPIKMRYEKRRWNNWREQQQPPTYFR